jgi:hypothetical protein
MAYKTRRFKLHLQYSNTSHPEPNQPVSRIDTYFLTYVLKLSSHLRLGLLTDPFYVGLPGIKFCNHSYFLEFCTYVLLISVFLI